MLIDGTNTCIMINDLTSVLIITKILRTIYK